MMIDMTDKKRQEREGEKVKRARRGARETHMRDE
jgi:hypothetical protein